MAWYWIVLLVLSVAAGPFEAMYVFNKARKLKEERERRQREKDPPEGKEEDKRP